MIVHLQFMMNVIPPLSQEMNHKPSENRTKYMSKTGKNTAGSKKQASLKESDSEETLVKSIFSRDKNESSASEINPSYDQNSSKAKTKKNKKIVYTETDEPLSAHRANINIASENKVYEQNEQTYTMNNRLHQFEATIKSQLDILKIKMQHKFNIHKLNKNHHLEESEVKAKMDRMSQQGTSKEPSVPQQFNTTVLPVFHHPLTTAPPVFQRPITTAPPVFHQPFTTAPPRLHHQHTSQFARMVHPHNMSQSINIKQDIIKQWLL
ncbi:unnamed protein product [Mytilus coruscus]|uniref:Uncharacterized protein n=1 Tax=Mytilus coruscus TaxID=42192 RepID=A0A6J8BGV3_MYTCO|nr:unnamed protein product [Mytilus coruscus]